MTKRIHILAAVALFLSCTSIFAASGPVPLPIGGNFTDASGGTGHFTGQFQLTQFAVENNQLVAKGFVSGVLTDSTGRVLGSAMKNVSIPVAVNNRSHAATSRRETSAIGIAATCEILHLDLGPLSLDLLGLQVNLNDVVLDISAQSGSGNLLGNLLCAVTHLLDGAGSLADLSNLLNQILQALTNILG